MSKYPLLKERLLSEGLIGLPDLIEPDVIDDASLQLVHTPDYLRKLASGTLSPAELRRLGLPWSDVLWQRSLRACGGTLLASRAALASGLAANLAGGTHHAFADHGEGFCVLNDVAVAIVRLRQEGRIGRAVVIDLDVHQGNGTAAIFEKDEDVYTFSMHGERNYPARKLRSSLDIPLADGTGDGEYLRMLKDSLPRVMAESRPDIAYYVAGVDVAAGDRYGRLALTDAGVAARDSFVVETVRAANVPLIITLGGGYAVSRERTAELHVHVFRASAAHERAAANEKSPPAR